MADEDLIITVDSLDEPFDTTQETQRQEGMVRLKVPGREKTPAARTTTPAAATDDAVADLGQQLADQKRRTQEAERIARQATDAANTAIAQVEEARTVVADTRVTALDSEISSATNESASLKSALKAAMEAGEFDKATDLHEKIADARARLYSAKQEKARIEQDATVTRTHEGAVRPPQQQQTRTTVQSPEDRRQAILAGTTPATRAWLENHPDILDDPERGAEASLVHHRAVKAGLKPDTPEYFRYAEEQMGYTTVTKTPKRQQEPAARTNGERRVVESAPVDRGGGGGDDGGGGGSGSYTVELTRGELVNATDGTIVWNKGSGAPAHLIGKPIGAKEMARRKAIGMKEGRYNSPAVS